MSRLDSLAQGAADPAAKPKKKLSGPAAIAANVGMFAVTALLCFGLVRGVKSFASGSSSDGYVLTTTQAVEPGQSLSKANSAWRRVTGRPPQGAIVSATPDADMTIYAANTRFGPDKAVRLALVRRQAPVSQRASEELAGFVLSGADVSDVLPYLNAGDRVDVVAVVGDAKTAADPKVSTLIAGARVVALAPASGGRGGRAASAVIGVTDEQARMLTLLQTQAGHLSLVLSPRRLNGADAPETLWRPGSEFGFPSTVAAIAPRPAVEAAARPAPRTAEAAAPAPEAKHEPEGAFVAVITSTGTTQAKVEP